MNLSTFVADQEEWEEGFRELEREYELVKEQLKRVNHLAVRLDLFKEDKEVTCMGEMLTNAYNSLM